MYRKNIIKAIVSLLILGAVIFLVYFLQQLRLKNGEFQYNQNLMRAFLIEESDPAKITDFDEKLKSDDFKIKYGLMAPKK